MLAAALEAAFDPAKSAACLALDQAARDAAAAWLPPGMAYGEGAQSNPSEDPEIDADRIDLDDETAEIVASTELPMVRPIRPVKAVPAGYSLRSPPLAGLVSRSRSLLMVPSVSLENHKARRGVRRLQMTSRRRAVSVAQLLVWRAFGHFYGIGDAAINPPRHPANGGLGATD